MYFPGDREPAPESAGSLAERTGGTVVCPRYRSVYPAALEDVHAAYEYCRTLGTVAVAGAGLGGGLATAMVLKLRDAGTALPTCTVLVSALLDLNLEAPSLLFNAATRPAADIADLRRRVAQYAAGAAPDDPLLSPLYANLHGLPPVQLLVAGTDLLLDDSLAFAARAARSGVTVELRVRPDSSALRADLITTMATFIAAWEARAGRPGPGRVHAM
jgi:acetyl esterase/lipase